MHAYKWGMKECMPQRRKDEGKKERKRVMDFDLLLHVQVKACVFVMLDALHYQKSVTLEPHASWCNQT